MRLLYPLLIILSFLTLSCTLPRPANPNLYKPDDPRDIITLNDKKQIHVLALSGGGLNGAWGAGYLNGWKMSGEKPTFDVVTGISTGSMIASFAFIDTLESADLIKRSYTSIEANDLIDLRPLSIMIFNNSLSSSKNLETMVEKTVTDKVIDQVAAEGKKGRKLYIGTTSLDRGAFRLWDMTDIAINKEYSKYRKILIASSSIPVLFSPVFIDGDMNVDGGVSKNIFVPPEIIATKVPTHIYVVYNGIPNAIGSWEIKNNLKTIAERTVAILLEDSNIASVREVRSYSRRNPNIQFYFSCVNKNIKLVGFDFTKDQLESLYNAGVETGRMKIWEKDLDGYLKRQGK